MPPLSITFQDLVDIAFLILLYLFVFYKKWRQRGKDVLIINTTMYIYLGFVIYFTLMPIITALPSILDHTYIPMHLEPFADLTFGRGNALHQIILNIIMTIPFGILLPLTQKVQGYKQPSFLKTFSYTFLLSLGIELLQPLLSNSRSSDITDLITNVIGGVIGYILYLLFRPLLNKLLEFLNPKNSSTKSEEL